MDDRYAPQPIARWYMVAAGASLVFMLLGCAALVIHHMSDPAKLPLDQRMLFEAEPAWVLAASAISNVAGTVGALLLIARRRAAERLTLLSLAAVIVWLAGLLLVAPLRDALSTNDIAIAIVVTLLTWTIYAFARHSRQRGWLR